MVRIYDGMRLEEPEPPAPSFLQRPKARFF
jgi:hypothetical protein